MIAGIHHVGLTVADLDRARTFIGTALPFTPVPEAPLPTLAGTAPIFRAPAVGAWLGAPNCYLELLAFDDPDPPAYRPVNQAGITHICIQSHSMTRLYEHFATAGATFHAAPTGLGTGALYCYARDLEQNVFELESLPFAPPVQPPWVAHVALATTQIARMADFYHQALGGTRLGGQKIGPDPRFDQITALADVELIPTWIVGHNLSIELWQFVHPPTIPAKQRLLDALGYSHICLEVTDLEAALAGCCAAGAAQVTPALAGAGARSAFVSDPDGNLIELLQLLPTGAAYAVERLADHNVVSRVAALRPQ